MFWGNRSARQGQPVSRRAGRRPFRPVVEALEERWLPSTFTWFQSVDGDFNDASHWRDQNGNDGVPGPADDVNIPGSGFTVTSATDNTVRSLNANARLTLAGGTFAVGDAINNSALAQLVVSKGAIFQVTAGTTFVTNGTESLGGMSVAANAKLVFSGGTHHLDTATNLAGTGEYHLTGGVLSVDANVNAPANFHLDGGILTGTGTFTVTASTLDWTGGEMSGLGGQTVIAADASLLIDGQAQKNLRNGYSLTTNGTVTWQGSGGLLGDLGASLTNNGTWWVQGDLSLFESSGPDAVFTNTASGVFTKTAGPGALYLGEVFNNAGTVNVNSGTLQLDRGGYSTGTFNLAAAAALQFTRPTYTLAAGTTVTGAGLTRLDGATLLINANTQLPDFAMSSGTLSGTSTLTVDGSFTWTGGEMNGSGSLVSNGTVLIDGPAQKNLRNGYSLISNGTAFWQGSGGLLGDIGATITNSGTWMVQSDLSLFEASAPDAVFTNTANGVFTKAAGPGTLYFGAIFNNAGTVNINSGTLQLDRGGYSTGTFNGSTGTTLVFTRNVYTLTTGSSLPSIGLVQVNGAAVVIDAAVSVGSLELDTGSVRLTANGILNVGGNYTQRANTTLVIDLGGLAPGAGYGQVHVNGVANLAGNLTVDLTSDFSPHIGDSYQALTFGSVNGGFDNVFLPNLGSTARLGLALDPGDLSLEVM